MVFKSIKSGFKQTWFNKRMILVFYLVNLFFGLIVMLPFRSALGNFIGHSLMGAKLGGRIDMDFVFEFFKNSSNSLLSLRGLIIVIPLAYWLFGLFLSGGAFSVFASDERYRSGLFWGGSANYFGRFFRLFLWSIPVFIILFLLQFVVNLFEVVIFGSDPYQYISFWGDWIKVGLRYISIFLFILILDYARIYTVITDARKMRKSLWQGIRFVWQNFFKAVALGLVLFVAGLIVLILYNLLANALSANSGVVVFLLLLLQQLYIAFRMLLRLTLYSSELQLFRNIVPQPARAQEEMMGGVEFQGAGTS